MKKETKKRIGSCLFYALVLGLTLWYVFHGQDLDRMLEYIRLADIRLLLPAVAAVVAFILGESFIIFRLLRLLGADPKPGHCALYSFIGFFYSAVTPSASGGQPMQLLAMRKDSIPSAVSCVVLAIVTIAYKLVLVVVGLLVMLLRPAGLMQYLTGAEPLVLLGLVLNVGFIALLLAAVFVPSVVRAGAALVLKLLRKLPRFRDSAELEQLLDESLRTYHAAADVLRGKPLACFQIFLITLAQRFFLFAVVWLVYLSFGFRQESGLAMMLLQAMISVAVDMLPLPGGMGISESLFLSVFTPIFGEVRALPGMVLTRGIGYYTQLLISAVMTVAADRILGKGKSEITKGASL